MMKKRETLDRIESIKELVQVIKTICENSGLSEVKLFSENVLSATEKGALKITVHKFILTLSELGGKVPQILEVIKSQTQITDEITIVTNHPKKISEYFQKWIMKESGTNKINFWSQTDIINQIDNYLSDYWGHHDLFLKSYEDRFLANVRNEAHLKNILMLDKKFESLLNVFIDPKIYIFKEDKETERATRIKIPVERLLRKENFIISGDAGTGKSTLLKHLGELVVESNQKNTEKTIPVFIKVTDIQEWHYSIEESIQGILARDTGINDLDELLSNYKILLLIDSIDEFEKQNRKIVLEDLGRLSSEKGINVILCTRNYDNLTEGCNTCEHQRAYISNFDQRQVKLYLDNFFKFDLAKSNQLWESLLDNKILERIPVTPLTISLISVLYEEKHYEVPATITDVYDNFNQFLLGRVNVKSRLEFLDINIKERLLSLYALDIISTPNRQKKTKDEFIKYVKDFFRKKSITINEDLVPELLNSLTEGTGILYLDEKGYIAFKHEHFMEYYASREIFIKHDRIEYEKRLIERFTEYNWQNTAIFYTGRTKDMPEFLEKLIERVELYADLNDCLLAISGLGYILQSLWMTDSVVRKEGIVKALELLIRADARVKQLANDKVFFFKGIRDIDIAFMNLVWFFNHYNSIALRDPLNLAYVTLYEKLQQVTGTVFDHDKIVLLYQLFCIASTLDSGRNADSQRLEQLFDEHGLLNNPFFVLLFEESSKILELTNEKKLKEDHKTRKKLQKYIKGIRFYLESSSEDLRFTTFDILKPIKKVELFTEGKTDAIIISRAFELLTDYKEPYWNISSIDRVIRDSGGANELRRHLENLARNIQTEEDSKKYIIGIFDNDAKGNQEFEGLNKDNFDFINNRLRKHKSLNIYAIKLPIPDDEVCNAYHQDKQEFRFFSIEHYFPLEFLQSHNMVKGTAIPGVYEIRGNKNDFAKMVQEQSDEKLFFKFTFLLRSIDEICGMEVTYFD